MPDLRSRHLTALGLTIVLGLASRAVAGWLPAWWLQVGDGLYAAAVYWAIALWQPRLGALWTGIAAGVFCFGLELSQLWHTPWLDALRAHPLGGLFLGRGFSADDLTAYVAGCALVGILDGVLWRELNAGPKADVSRL